MTRYTGFQPLFNNDSRVLILGSFPSVKSRQTSFYYGNKSNRFWKTLAEAFGEAVPQSIDDKKSLCLAHGVALWDIVESCEIVGSLDADITNYRTVDLSRVLQNAPIKRILCNGATSFKITKSVYDGEIPVFKLCSTSPANVRFDKSEWLDFLQKT